MSTARRGRACDTCHSIKIKCELGTSKDSLPPCERCLRLGKTCSVTAPVKKKDRIAELEAKLEEMTRLLRVQELGDSASDAGTGNESRSGGGTSPATTVNSEETSSSGTKAAASGGRGSKKRRLENASPEADGVGSFDMDYVVLEEIQRLLLDKYQNEMQPVFPFDIRHGYDVLRDQHPMLLQAIIFAASPGVLSADEQDAITNIAVKLVAPDMVAKQEKSIELLQAVLMISFWYRPPRNQVHVAIDRSLNTALELAEELAISSSESALGIASLESNDKINSAEAWRTWNLCYLLASSLGSCMRFPPKIPWSVDMELKLSSLEYGRDSLPNDGLLCQFLRAERLCEQIAFEANYSTSLSVLEVTNHTQIRRIQNLIIDRKAQLFSSNSTPALRMYENIATLYLHECILHTPTNKASFAAPYVAERLSLTDFPAPVVTADHIPFLYGLRDACHTALNAVLALDYRDMAFAPIVTFTAKAFYAQWLLIKLYVAVTASGNTYGAFISAESLQVEHYLQKIGEIGDKICELDPEHMGGKGLQQSSRKIKEWVFNCDFLRAEDTLKNMENPVVMQSGLLEFGPAGPVDWSQLDYDGFGFGGQDMYGIPPA
ncbi:uncharacterized protein RCO7_09627 [Rhynchosporium graminicola]|uniref:Zn(2)-C6 fungal-type domain-containing protein n=1 Tax=Rhynchosporium graminicola TaxID=2792576 RepID=A0A1E1LC11_9HELO|nr:uncharacterized protein RCO7_09627 [Rhynchosporium commune]